MPGHLGQEWNVGTVRCTACTKCQSSPGIIRDPTPECHRVVWAWMYCDLTAERSFYSQGKLVCDVLDLLLSCYLRVFVQPGTDCRPVDWCRTYMSVL